MRKFLQISPFFAAAAGAAVIPDFLPLLLFEPFDPFDLFDLFDRFDLREKADPCELALLLLAEPGAAAIAGTPAPLFFDDPVRTAAAPGRL